MEDSNRNFKLQTCEDFIEVLASKAAVPGGGGAAALTGAIGIALGNMVGSLTVGKKTYADVEDEMWELKAKCDQLQKDFLRLIERDAEVFVTTFQSIWHAKRNRGRKRQKKTRVMEIRSERCMLCSDGNHGKIAVKQLI